MLYSKSTEKFVMKLNILPSVLLSTRKKKIPSNVNPTLRNFGTIGLLIN